MDSSTPIAITQHESGAPQVEASTRVCLITLGGELFAVDLGNVGEVFEVESITPVPGMSPVLAGVTNLRGIVIPLVDLRPMLGLASQEPAPKIAVMITHHGQQIGVLVDQIPEIRTVQANEFHASPSGGTKGARSFVSSVLRIENRISGVFEVPALLACVDSK